MPARTWPGASLRAFIGQHATDAMPVSVKSPDDIAKMRVAGRLAAELLDYLAPQVVPGITTGELDRIAHDYQVNVQNVVPATLNYAPPGHRPYPASICTSVNHVVCHGIPGDKKLKPGDIVNIDVTVIKDGWHGDTSRMFYVGTPSIQARRLVEVTYEAMWRGIRAVRRGRPPRRRRPHDPEVRGEPSLLHRPRILRPRNRPRVPRGAAGRCTTDGPAPDSSCRRG